VYWFVVIIVSWLCLILVIKAIRFAFEVYYAKNLIYMKVTLPRSDSKLDKEKETKKDFKEKAGMMSMFYKAIHKLSEAGLRDSFLDYIFQHAKVSLELVYEHGELSFYISTYNSFENLINQHITSIYSDAEVLKVEKKDYIDLKPKGYTARAASMGKENDDVFPIRSYKYLEDDPLNSFTNVFGGLEKDDKAIFQI